MTVAELIEALKEFPQDLNVEVDDGNFDFEIKYVTKTVSSFDLESLVCSITIEPKFS